MFTSPGEQEPHIQSDDAPTVKKRSKKKLGLSSVSRAFSKSHTSPCLSRNSPSDSVVSTESGVGTPASHNLISHDLATGSSLQGTWADGNVPRSASNPTLIKARTFDVDPGERSSPLPTDERTQPVQSTISSTLALRPFGYGVEDRGPIPSKDKGRVVSTSSHVEMLKKQPLRTSTSIPNINAGRSRISASQFRPRPPIPDRFHEEDVRTSFRSALTGSSAEVASGTERSSILTRSSSISEFSADQTAKSNREEEDQGMSVEDAVSMYMDGFDDKNDSLSAASFRPTSHDEHRRSIRLAEAMNDSIGDPSQAVLYGAIPSTDLGYLEGTVQSLVSNERNLINWHPPSITSDSFLRDRYGFKKASQHITLARYDEWSATYSKHLNQRLPKWEQYLKEHGLSSANPIRFPPKGPKGKRFIRKGIPPQYRGAAWFWYSGAYTQLHRSPGLYESLVRQVAEGKLSDVDQEHIERDLNRTFPDNVHFKPEPPRLSASVNRTGLSEPDWQYSDSEPDTPIIQALRRVLSAFALHAPKIGYCQSLNFLAGLFLLFLPEEKAFWILHVLTTSYLPGIHEISLEGANVDLWVLMTLLKESMPSVYAKTLSVGDHHSPNHPTRLPPITLCLTSWLMSLFIGTLPMETTLRVWDIFFYEGSRTFFRVALAIFKAGEKQVLTVADPMETFQVVQTIPRRLLDADNLIEGCYRRRGGFGHVTQERVDELRRSRREVYRMEKSRLSLEARQNRAVVAGGG